MNLSTRIKGCKNHPLNLFHILIESLNKHKQNGRKFHQTFEYINTKSPNLIRTRQEMFELKVRALFNEPFKKLYKSYKNKYRTCNWVWSNHLKIVYVNKHYNRLHYYNNTFPYLG